jgi:hypothetical protein
MRTQTSRPARWDENHLSVDHDSSLPGTWRHLFAFAQSS